MNRNQRNRAWLAVLICCLFAPALCGAEQSVAVVDMERVIRAYPETESAEAILQKQKEKYEAEQDELFDKGQALKQEFETIRDQAENRALSDAAREEKITEARAKMQELVELERTIRETTRRRKRDLAEEELRLQRSIVGKIHEKIVEYARNEKIDLVLDSAAISAGGVQTVIHHAERLDITDAIITLTGGSEASENTESGDDSLGSDNR